MEVSDVTAGTEELDLYWYYRQFMNDGARAILPLLSDEGKGRFLRIHVTMSREEFDAMIDGLRDQPRRLETLSILLKSGFYDRLRKEKLESMRQRLKRAIDDFTESD